jgi:hypothetical protein
MFFFSAIANPFPPPPLPACLHPTPLPQTRKKIINSDTYKEKK